MHTPPTASRRSCTPRIVERHPAIHRAAFQRWLLAHGLALTALGLLGACAPDDSDAPIETVYDPCRPLVIELSDSGRAERAAVEAAISMWNARAGTALTTEVVDGAPRVPVVFEAASAPFYGYYDDERGVVYVNAELRGREREVLIAHELGHALGLAHVNTDERPSVMNHGNLEVAPTEGDVDALAALWGTCG